MKHTRLAATLALALSVACAGTDGRPDPEDALPRVLVVHSDLDNVPFAYVDEAGQPAGRDVEMMELIADHLGLPLEWKRVPFERLLPAVESGEALVVCATLGITAERERRVAFTRPYYSTELAVVVRAGDGEPTSLRDLERRRVSAGAGTTSEAAVRRRLSDSIGVFENASGATTAERLLGFEVDAAVMDGPAADRLVASNAGMLARLDQNLGSERYALALPRASRGLEKALDAALESLEKNGELRALDASHGIP